MDTRPLTVREIFGQSRQYQVPLFQRPYIWNEEDQWEPLWDDVRTVAEGLLARQPTRPHFLGAIVLEQVRTPTGRVDVRLVIDGQQRLTTIQILLEAFADLAKEIGQERVHGAVLALTRNSDPLREKEEEAFKVWPTNQDRELFRRVMQEGSPAGVREALGLRGAKKRSGKAVADAYLYFHEALGEWLGQSAETEPRCMALLAAIETKLRLVVIDLDREDEAQLIFETLNARGTPLLPSDLVKNYLFRRAEIEKGDLEKLYDAWWRPFDEGKDYWRAEIGKGRTKRARIDIFLQDYLTVQAKAEVQVAHLYETFQEHLEGPEGGSVAMHLERMHRYARHFERFDAMPEAREATFFERLRALEMTTAHPFLLELFERHGKNPDAVRPILRDIESFFVRRMVCKWTTKQYNQLFISLFQVLDAPADTVAAEFRKRLASQEAETRRWPADQEFRQAWIEDPLGRFLSRGRLQMLILALEAQARGPKNEKVRYDDKLTVEHLMPQKWETHWPLPGTADRDVAGATRERLLQTIGNLTLLTSSLNPAVSNAPWAKKRQEIPRHSVLSLNNRVCEAATWDEDAIRRRGEELFLLARELWPRPA